MAAVRPCSIPLKRQFMQTNLNRTHAVGLALNFAATIFVGAFLLFQLQPLIGKIILPWFGGTPAVWTTCMLFFQSLLFGGYAYAHFTVRWLKPKQQGLVHFVLIVLALALLRVVPDESWKPAPGDEPVGRILMLLAATVGFPYFVLSSTGPLLQAWFARVFPGRIPYRLYALSNFGSLLALLSYPFFFERVLAVDRQAGFWWWGFIIYGVLCAAAAISVWMIFRNGQETEIVEDSALPDQPMSQPAVPAWWHRAAWLMLPTLGSVTMLAVINHLSIDVPPMPFLWVLALALYLVTFIIAFDHAAWYRPVWFAVPTLVAVYLVAMFSATSITRANVWNLGTPGRMVEWTQHLFAPSPVAKDGEETPKPLRPKSPKFELGYKGFLALNLAALFGICMICHGELVRLRPHPKYLTSFYLLISAGGALGGLFVSLVAPHIFSSYFEFNLALILGFLLAVAVVVRGLVNWLASWRRSSSEKLSEMLIPATALSLLVVVGISLFDMRGFLAENDDDSLFRKRNFFGILSVKKIGKDNESGRHYILKHGSITHGLQLIESDRNHFPTTYYGQESGVGHTIGFFRRAGDTIGGMRIGAVGLGTGTLAAYIDPGDKIRFYEINPVVVDIAEPGKWFTFLKDCKGEYEIVMGDARLSLEQELLENRRQRYHVLILDAFSGDAIPAHLLTKEAFETYIQHLATPEAGGADGAIAVHISNRYVDLEPIVYGLANQFGMETLLICNDDNDQKGVYASDWMILTRNKDLIEDLKPFAEPSPEKRDPPQDIKPVLWTDAFNNLFDALK